MRAQKALQTLSDWGVEDIGLCPGGRNSPFVFLLSETSAFQIHSGFDERSTAFFTLGKAQVKNKPSAIITTSGTAVSEVLSAVIEAHYTQTPLIVISADRPVRLRGTGAPQTIEQKNIFSSYVENCVDIEDEWPAEIRWSGRGPLHLNICFDEPLIDGAVTDYPIQAPSPKAFHIPRPAVDGLAASFHQFLSHKKQPLLLISGLKASEVSAVKAFAQSWSGYIYAESTSGLRELQHPRLLRSGDRFPSYLLKNKKIDAVIRIGGVPTARLWRDLENSEFPIFSLSSLPFAGLSRGIFHCTDYSALSELQAPKTSLNPEILDLDQKLAGQWQSLLQAHPLSEPAFVNWLSRQVSQQSQVYVGNSLPIREWDLTAQREKPVHVKASRGANGIDGQIATALGQRTKSEDQLILIGDLTAMYDANALWFLKNQTPNTLCQLTVMNNNGGKIFERLFKHPLFYNQHHFNFKAWAESWSCPYTLMTEPVQWPSTSGVIEVRPDLEQTAEFWKKFDGLWSL